MASMKREKDHYKLKWEAEREKRKVVSLAIEEEKDLN